MALFHSPHFPILYQDQELLVFNKPPGLICHPVGHYQGDSVICRLQPRFGPVWLAHRLDQGTSGVLILTRTPKAAKSLNRQFEKRHIQKHYLALVQGQISNLHGHIQSPLNNDESPNAIIKIRMKIDPQGFASDTEYDCLARNENMSLLYLTPHTGRKHQIRLHLASLGHPILGENLYAQAGLPFLWEYYFCRPYPEIEPMNGHALHASDISLQHPTSKETIRFSAELPAFWQTFLDRLQITWAQIQEQMLDRFHANIVSGAVLKVDE